MADVQFVDGKILFVSGDVAMHECCCCDSSPCVCCTGTQPSATVTLDDGCGGACTAAGVYTYDSFGGGGTACAWIWRKAPWTLTVFYTDVGGWEVELISVGGDLFVGFPTTLSCVDGEITGVADLPDDVGAGDCSGCTATVTFG